MEAACSECCLSHRADWTGFGFDFESFNDAVSLRGFLCRIRWKMMSEDLEGVSRGLFPRVTPDGLRQDNELRVLVLEPGQFHA